MSFKQSYVAQRLLEGYIKTPLSLKEQTLENLALKLCYNSELKNHIFFPKLLIADSYSPEQVRNQWEEYIIEQSTAICKTLLLPYTVQEELIGHIRSTALKLLCWSGQWKEVFDISCGFTANLWMPEDWTESRINARKIAERVMQDDRLSIHQRYRLACIYCLEEFLPLLWDKIPLEQRDVYDTNDDLAEIVLIWSECMRNPEVSKHEEFFKRIFKDAIFQLQMQALIFSWNKLTDSTKLEYITIFNNYGNSVCQMHCFSPEIFPFMENVKISLPSPSAQVDLIFFFLLKLREQKRADFEAMLKSCERTIEFMLKWPH